MKDKMALPPWATAYLSYRLVSVARILGKQFRHMMSAHGLNRTQGAILGHLFHRGDAGATASDLRRCIGVTAASMSNMLAQLERERLITRTPHPDDARAMLIHLTPEGRERLEVFPQAMEVLDARAFAGFSEEEREQLRAFLARIEDNLQAFTGDDDKEHGFVYTRERYETGEE